MGAAGSVTFEYEARNPAGELITGTLAAGSEQLALAELHARELAPVRVEPMRGKSAARIGRGRVNARGLATAYRQLGDLLRAGVPLLRGLRLLGRSRSNPRLAAIYKTIADDVADGSPLAEAMLAHPQIFPDIQVAMIRAGERGSFLEEVLTRLADLLERQADMRATLIGNLIYPVILLIAGVAIAAASLVFFVPKFEQFFADRTLPLPTRILLTVSDMLTTHWVVVSVVVIAAIGGVWYAMRQPALRRMVSVHVLRVPVLGKLVSAVSISRFARTLGTLLANGIGLLAALQISRDAAGHPLLAEAIDEAADRVRAGESLAPPLERSTLFPDDVLEMISVGEQANNLDAVLLTTADTIDGRIDRLLAIFMRLLEPLLLLVIAGMVFFLFLALVVPMLQMSSGL